jgi:hypothetical protein
MEVRTMKWMALLSLALLLPCVSIVALPAVESPAEELATVEGGRNGWLCALSVAGGLASVATGNVPGALVSSAGINKFC